MWIVYGVWAWAVITTWVKWLKYGEVVAANHGIMAAAVALLVTFLALIVIWFTKPKLASPKKEAHDLNNHAISNSAFHENPYKESINDDSLYEVAYDEVSENKFRKGIMAKAIVEADGDLNKQRALYIKHRVQSLKDEIKLAKQEELRQKATEYEEKSRQQRIKDVDDYFGRN